MICKMLKWDGHITLEKLEAKAYEVSYREYEVILYDEHEETEEDKEKRQKEINTLKQSIEKREKLLANEAFVKKAPASLVEQEKEKLKSEKKKMEQLEGE